MQKQKIIRPSNSPWNSPLWVVPKKTDASGKAKWRIVIDFRKLNDITEADKFPLPNIEDILDNLGRAKYFTTLDLTSGFHQVSMNERDIPKTAFSTEDGHWEYTKMPFGLKNAPATFQRLMNSVLSGLTPKQCLVYLDDIIIFGNSLEQHNERLISVLKTLEKNNLKVQPDKCEFLRTEVKYLGHIISNKGVKPNPDKIETIQNFPIPRTPTEIKSFLGLTGYYRRFIRNFAKIAKPMTAQLKKDCKTEQTKEFIEAFKTLKKTLITAPILQYPKFDEEFVLTTDASQYAAGAVLSQGPIGRDLPISYASRTLNPAETRYSTIERELLAIVWAVKHFRPYLYGKHFKIVTDHRSLTWLFSNKDSGSRLMRWRLQLENYDYEIIYKKGSLNKNADCLSRIKISPLDINFEMILFPSFSTYNETEKMNTIEEIAELTTPANLVIPCRINEIPPKIRCFIY